MRAIAPFVLAARTNLLRCAGLLAVGAAAAIWTQRLAADAESLQTREVQRRTLLIASREAAGSDVSEVEAGEARLREWAARGILGPEHRRDWLRRITEIKETLRLPEIEFELAPQQPAVIEGAPQRAGRHEFLASPMKLRIGLLHEQDLLSFFEALERSVSAIPRIRSCRIERATEAGAAAAARLWADCRVDWITLRERP